MSAGPVAAAVRVRGLTKRYGSTVALDDVDLEVAPGELRGLLGLNGAGKTTLLRALFGLLRPDAGTVELLGQPLFAGRGRVPCSVAGFVEEPAFYGYLSGRTNLELLVELDEGGEADIDGALRRVGLGDRASDRVGAYSTGMRQRLGIAAALLRQPRLLLLDEPTSGLDPAGARAVSELLRELTAEGTAVVLSSHLIGELEALCDTYTVVRDGRVVWDGGADRLEVQAPGAVFLLLTSDDRAALDLGRSHRGLQAGWPAAGPGLRLAVAPGALDGYVTALVHAGVAIRRLELLVSPLESMFFALTTDGSLPLPENWLKAQIESSGPELMAL